MIYEKDIESGKSRFQSNKRLLKLIKKKFTGSFIDQLFHKYHRKAFSQIDCLQCANCCKTTSPIILNSDINRISRLLKMKASDFIDSNLLIDEDGDFVFNRQPCPFLAEDNYCSIYESRPKACREYPHTNRKDMIKILNLCSSNSRICPAVSRILEGIETELGKN